MSKLYIAKCNFEFNLKDYIKIVRWNKKNDFEIGLKDFHFEQHIVELS